MYGLGDVPSQFVLFGEIVGTVGVIPGIHGRHTVKPRAVFGDFSSQLVVLEETAGILGRNLVKPRAVSGYLEVLLQYPESSYPDLAVNKILGELVAAC